jgi:hypothetical protein
VPALLLQFAVSRAGIRLAVDFNVFFCFECVRFYFRQKISMPFTPYRVFLSLSIVFLSLSFSVHGQKNFMDGYIIDKNRDSLRGQIDYRDWGTNPDHILFRQTATDKGKDLGTAELLAFGVSGDRYETHTVHIFPYMPDPEQMMINDTAGAAYDTTIFLQVAVSGKLTLWEYRETTGTNYYFINGKDGKPEELRMITRIVYEDGSTRVSQESRYKNQLVYLLQDCAAAVSKVKNTEYTLGALRKLIFTYNNCGKDTVETTPRKRDRGSVQFFPLAGFVTTSVKFTGNDPIASQRYPASASPVLGAGALFIVPWNRKRFSFVTDLVWQHFHSVSSSVEETSFSIDQVGHIDYSLLKLDVLFRYRFPTGGKVRPFLEAGISNGTAMGIKAYQSYQANQNNYSYTQAFPDGAIRTYQQGWLLGAGLSAGHWSLEGRFEAGPPISYATEVFSPTNSWYALLSYSL